MTENTFTPSASGGILIPTGASKRLFRSGQPPRQCGFAMPILAGCAMHLARKFGLAGALSREGWRRDYGHVLNTLPVHPLCFKTDRMGSSSPVGVELMTDITMPTTGNSSSNSTPTTVRDDGIPIRNPAVIEAGKLMRAALTEPISARKLALAEKDIPEEFAHKAKHLVSFQDGVATVIMWRDLFEKPRKLLLETAWDVMLPIFSELPGEDRSILVEAKWDSQPGDGIVSTKEFSSLYPHLKAQRLVWAKRDKKTGGGFACLAFANGLNMTLLLNDPHDAWNPVFSGLKAGFWKVVDAGARRERLPDGTVKVTRGPLLFQYQIETARGKCLKAVNIEPKKPWSESTGSDSLDLMSEICAAMRDGYLDHPCSRTVLRDVVMAAASGDYGFINEIDGLVRFALKHSNYADNLPRRIRSAREFHVNWKAEEHERARERAVKARATRKAALHEAEAADEGN